MPYNMVKTVRGYFVTGPSGPMSSKPLPLDRAKRQLRALYLHVPDSR